VIVTNDLVHFKTVADKLGLEHQICQPALAGCPGFYVRRWVGRTSKELRKTIPGE
jgi:hypothetical protein